MNPVELKLFQWFFHLYMHRALLWKIPKGVSQLPRTHATTPFPYKNLDGYLQLSRAHISMCLRHKVLHNNCFQFIVGLTIALEKLERKLKLNFRGKQLALWKVALGFSKLPLIWTKPNFASLCTDVPAPSEKIGRRDVWRLFSPFILTEGGGGNVCTQAKLR